jgi:hypothetical protein
MASVRPPAAPNMRRLSPSFGADCSPRDAAQPAYRRAAEWLSEGPFERRFLFASGRRPLAGRSPGDLSEGIAMTGKRGLWRARSSSCGVGDGAVAGVVLRDVGCPEELTSPVSFPVPAGINRLRRLWHLSPEPCRQSRYRAARTIRGRPQWRSGSVSFRARRGSATARRAARSGVRPRRCWSMG